MDSQHESLEKVVKAKAFAKAVKADNAEISIYLWNKRIIAPSVTQEQRDAALTVLRKLGHRWFLRGLLRDCVEHVHKTHVTSWKKPRRTKDGELMELGSDVQAIAGILWHATQTNWFKFHAGLKLVFFRFPA